MQEQSTAVHVGFAPSYMDPHLLQDKFSQVREVIIALIYPACLWKVFTSRPQWLSALILLNILTALLWP